MKATSVISLIFLIFIGISAAVYAMTGFNLPLAVCFYNETAYKILLSFSGVCALWLIFWLIAFKPFSPLS